MTTNTVAIVQPKPKAARSPLLQALAKAIKKPTVAVSSAWVFILLVVTAIPKVFSPMDPQAVSLLDRYALPSPTHLLGADNLGRDVLSRLIWGGAGGFQAALLAVAVALAIGVTLGLIAGYSGGWFDQLVAFYANVLMALPGFIILLAVAFVTKNNIPVMMVTLGVIFSGAIVRLVRAQTQSVSNLLYVDSARVSGMSSARIVLRHVLPNVMGPLVVQAFLFLSVGFLIYASLSFLGLGFDPQSPDWGQMVLQGTKDISMHPWLMVPIGVALSLTILAFNQIGSGLRASLPQAQRESMLVGRKVRKPGRIVNVKTAVIESAPVASAVDTGAILNVASLTVSFPTTDGEIAVVDRVSLHVNRGEVLGLVGESGCGKSMTALALMGLVPQPGVATAQSLTIDGVEAANLPEKERAKLRGSVVAMISQEPMVALDPCFTVQSTLIEAIRTHKKLSRGEAKVQALGLLKKVGFAKPEKVLASYPHQLSGGMAQRVAIALALTGSPKILIADEPTTALDVTIQAEILDLLLDLRDSEGMTIVLVTHDLGVVSDVCDRVAVMYAGEVVETGSIGAVFNKPSHPYTEGLLGAVPDLAADHGRLVAIPGRVPLPKEWPSHCRFYYRCPVRKDSCSLKPIELEAMEPHHEVRCAVALEISERR